MRYIFFNSVVATIKHHYIFVFFIFVYLISGLFLYKDFGTTGDEWTERRATENLARYFGQPTSYESIMDEKYNDPISYELGHHPLVSKYQRAYQLIQYSLNTRGYYEWDHLINIFFSIFFFVIVYTLLYLHYTSRSKAMLGVIFLLSTPRLIGDIPTNNKDVPFALMYFLCLFLIYFLSRNKINVYVKVIFLGLSFGLMQSTRTIGFSIYIIYIIFNLVILYRDMKTFFLANLGNILLETSVIFIFSLFISVSMFPWLGANFYMNFYALLADAKSFQNWEGMMLFLGKTYFKDTRPWYYLPVWIAITIPIYQLISLLAGIFIVQKMLKNSLYLLFSLSLLLNLLLYFIFQPVIYNGLRHFLFLLPILSILSALVVIEYFSLSKKVWQSLGMSLCIGINIVIIFYHYFMLHPYQYIYFNEIVGGLKGASGKFEMDYWGATYKEATQWFVKNRSLTHEDIIYACNVDYAVDYYSEKEFFMSYGYPEKANYIICDFDTDSKDKLTGEVIYEVKREGVVLNRIRKNDESKIRN